MSGEPKTRIGRIRPATFDELEQRFRADAVLALKSMPDDLQPLELHVATLIDGFRPVARLRKKSGLSSDELRQALDSLDKRGVLKLVGVVEEALGEVALDIQQEIEGTMPKGQADVIPPHVMREIQTMLDEENAADFEGEATRETTPIKDD